MTKLRPLIIRRTNKPQGVGARSQNYHMEEQPSVKEKSPLRLLREKAGLTRPQVKQVIGVSERRQADWESGTALPTIENAVALAKLYKVSLKEICRAIGVDVTGVPDDNSIAENQ